MRTAAQLTVVLVTALLSTGCVVPWPRKGQVVVAPEIHGRVVDANTGEGVAGAEVSVDKRAQTVTRTAPDGTFHIAQQSHKYCIEFIEPGGVMGYCPPAGEILWRLAVTHPGYSAFEEGVLSQADVATDFSSEGPFVLRDIKLYPKQQ